MCTCLHERLQRVARLDGGERVQIRDVPIVGVTCLSAARSPILRSRLFDVCIVDEATQVTLPVCLAPLLRCRTFVLVGDHLQLPPLVQSPQAQVQLSLCSVAPAQRTEQAKLWQHGTQVAH